jgi:hypothetical protein
MSTVLSIIFSLLMCIAYFAYLWLFEYTILLFRYMKSAIGDMQ